MRSDDPAYLELVDRWWSVLLPKIGRFLVERGGNILMVQVDHLYSLMPWQLRNFVLPGRKASDTSGARVCSTLSEVFPCLKMQHQTESAGGRSVMTASEHKRQPYSPGRQHETCKRICRWRMSLALWGPTRNTCGI